MKSKINLKLSGLLAVGVLALAPAVSAAAADADTNITVTLDSTISMTTSGNVAIGLAPGSGSVVSSNSDTVSVSTNSNAGYTLTLENADATTNLVSGSDNIAAHAGTAAAPSTLGDNSWGFAVAGGSFDASYAQESNQSGSSTTWAGVPASGSGVQLKETSETASGDQTTVWYGVKVTSEQPNGSYLDTVTYTATAKS